MPILSLLLVVGLPAAEIYTFVVVGEQIGGLATLGLVLLSTVIGGAIIRLQGLSLLPQMQQAMARHQPPAAALLNGMAVLLAGLLLIIPGFLTDALAVLLLLPPLRRGLLMLGLAAFARRWTASAGSFGSGGFAHPHQDFPGSGFAGQSGAAPDIEGDYRDVTPHAPSGAASPAGTASNDNQTILPPSDKGR
ncbi:FxsA family protein [Insolitispirillum peregrinum]|uniref:FxsA family protein n=1 Tax=Insolitispirillum peregrinum TaxID=80876 RepID=UPI00361C4BCE